MKCFCIEVASGRSFGEFKEKTLLCNTDAQFAIKSMCKLWRNTDSWETTSTSINNEEYFKMTSINNEEYFKMTKIPIRIITTLLKILPSNKATLLEKAAFSISMEPEERTCMNVIVGTENKKSKILIKKFSLYYPDNNNVLSDRGLLEGVSFRTGVFKHGRQFLKKLKNINNLMIDNDSIYEDCVYIKNQSDMSYEDKINTISKVVNELVQNYPSELKNSYNLSDYKYEIQREWDILLKHSRARPTSSYNLSPQSPRSALAKMSLAYIN